MTKQTKALELAKTAIQSLNGVGEVIQWNNQWELCHNALLSIDAALNEPTPEQYAMGYAEGFNDACRPQRTLTRTELEELAHRRCTRYWHSPDSTTTPHFYTFNIHHLMDLYRDILEVQEVHA